MDAQGLLLLKQKVETAKKKMAELKGEETALLKQLKEWSCSSLEEAEKLIAVYNKKIEKLEQQIEEKIEELQNDYNIEEL